MTLIKLIFIFFFTLLISFVKANEVKIIELHTNKSLDQLVLETSDKKEKEFEEAIENKNTLDIEQINDQEKDNKDSDQIIDNTDIIDDTVRLINNETILDLNEVILNKYLDSITSISSKVLRSEFINTLANAKIDNENFTEEKIYYIIKKLYELGEIQKAYNLVKQINSSNIIETNYLNYFYLIELNFLYSSYKLEEVCDLKSILLKKNIFLPNKLLEKTDIFCLTLENNISEAKLLNSLLLETENDDVFQKLLNYMIVNEKNNNFQTINIVNSKELIFLYSAMLRINELPLDENFIKIDPLNLSIPLILSKSTRMNTRIKAAHRAYFDKAISINSLSALYQSVDFNSDEFNQPEKTLAEIKDKEIAMAFYYQLANMQIFPDDRLNVILEYWNFSKKMGLEQIAFKITEKIIDTFEPSAENSKFAIEIASAHIANENYEEALNWISVSEISGASIENIEYLKFLLELNKNNEVSTIEQYLINNFNQTSPIKDQFTLESIDVVKNFLTNKTNTEFNLFYENITDTRLMPSYFLMREIEYNADKKNDLSLLFLSIISIQNKKWIELHPEHLQLILSSLSLYDDGNLTKGIILEILNELGIF